MKVYLLWQMYCSEGDGQEPPDEVIRVYSTYEKAHSHTVDWPIISGRFDYRSEYYIEEREVD